jgi:hypothetical protein
MTPAGKYSARRETAAAENALPIGKVFLLPDRLARKWEGK